MAKVKSPLDVIIETKMKVAMFNKYGETALQGQTMESFMQDVESCLDVLMDYRNMTLSMAQLNVTPQVNVLQHLSQEDIARYND